MSCALVHLWIQLLCQPLQASVGEPWLTSDLGAPAITGSADYVDDHFSIVAGGTDIWGSEDECHFVYQTVSGDCEIIARVDSLEESDVWAKSGVMIRETLDADSKNALLALRAANGVTFQRRSATNGSTVSTKLGVDPSPGVDDYDPPYWLRLNRSGNVYSAWHSPDGENWTQIGAPETLELAANVYIGMAVTSHNASFATTSEISQVSMSGADVVRTPVTVSSIEALQAVADHSFQDVRMTPGIYWLTGPELRLAPEADYATFLDLSGDQSTYDFTGVTFKVDTRELAGYGRVHGHGDTVRVLQLSGTGTTVYGLTLEMVHLAMNGVDSYGLARQFTADWSTTLVEVVGDGSTVKDCEFTTGGSYPYGYGDAFGKGGRPTDPDGNLNAAWIDHRKQSGIRLGKGASGITLENVTLNMRSYGHGIFMQDGVSDIVLRNCAVLGDTLVSSDTVLAHPVYQQWGAATYGEPIPPGINLSKHEDGIRVYINDNAATNGWPQYVENLTVENCRVERMRDALATGDMESALVVTDTEAYGCEQGFTPTAYGSNLFTGCKGDAVNGPLVFFRRSASGAVMEVELAGNASPIGQWPIALISGSNNEVTLTRSASAGLYPDNACVMVSQHWREWRHRPNDDIDVLTPGSMSAASTGNTIVNQTGKMLVLGKNTTGNDAVSDGGVLNKGSANSYIGQTVVLPYTEMTDTWGTYTFYSGQQSIVDSLSLGGDEADAGTVVEAGGQLMLTTGLNFVEGNQVILSGAGPDGKGALYSDGAVASSTRLNLTSGIAIDGATTIGVGVSGSQLLVGPISGNGDLYKVGLGHLAMENSGNTFTGTLHVLEGSIGARSNKVRSSATIAEAAQIQQITNLGINQFEDATLLVNGTLDLNARGSTDTNRYEARVGPLNGSGAIVSTASLALQTIRLRGASGQSDYMGTIDGNIDLIKEGDYIQILSGTCSHSGTTSVDGGELTVNGLLSADTSVTVNAGGILSGNGHVAGSVSLASRSVLSPGEGIGSITLGALELGDGSGLRIEMNAVTGSAGSSEGWNIIEVDNAVTLTGTGSSPVKIQLIDDGSAFQNHLAYAWTIIEAGEALSGISSERITVDTTQFESIHPLDGGQFSVLIDGNLLKLRFTPSDFAVWKQAQGYGGAFGFTNDPEGNHLALGLEFALGLTPGNNDVLALPQLINVEPSGEWSYRFKREQASVVYQVFYSENLADWTLLVEDPGEVGDWIHVKYPEEGSEPARLFYKLAVELATPESKLN